MLINIGNVSLTKLIFLVWSNRN